MAWQNPATWSWVDRLQGQNNKPKAAPTPSTPDPFKVYGTINGRRYNYAGEFLDPDQSKRTQDSAFDKEMAGLRDELKRLQAQAAATPKLAQFDVMSNWNKAQSAAERAVNPLYTKKLNDFLAKQATQKSQAQKQFTLTKESIGQEKANTLQDNVISRQRTTEDVNRAIEDVNAKEGIYQTDEGNQFDEAYRQVSEQVAAEGGAQTGLGRQQTADMIRLRNVQSQRQLDEFQGQREAKQLFKTRTFEDLAIGDERAVKLAESKTKAAQFDLDSYLEDLVHDEKAFRLENESQRLGAIYDEAQKRERVGVEQFLGSLAGQGFDAKDIAYNRQVYAR